MKNFKIAIDGPSGVGKSTAAKAVAARLKIAYIDTGAMFRTIALYFLEKGLDVKDEKTVTDLLEDIDVDIKHAGAVQRMFLLKKDVTESIRSKEVSQAASVISQYPAVRLKVLKLERKLSDKKSVVMDGRDIGTVVLPDADLKIFLTANSRERTLRRFRELETSGKLGDKTFEDIRLELDERDNRDINRKEAPLVAASDAVLIDSTDMDAREVEEKIISLLNGKLQKSNRMKK